MDPSPMFRWVTVLVTMLTVCAHAGDLAQTGADTLARLDAIPEITKAERLEMVDFLAVADRKLTPFLRHVESMEVFSLEPREVERGRKDRAFHGFRVLGSIAVKDQARLEAVRDSLISGVDTPLGVMCYDPRHGVRMRTKEGVIDVEICFECGQARVYGLPKQKGHFFCGFMPQKTLKLLNGLLDEAKIPRDQPPVRPLREAPGDAPPPQKIAFYVDRLGDTEYVRTAIVDGREHTTYKAAEELGLYGIAALAPLMEKLPASKDDYERSATLYALRLAAHAPEIEMALGSTLPKADLGLPPLEDHQRLQTAWLAWWTRHEDAVRQLAEQREHRLVESLAEPPPEARVPERIAFYLQRLGNPNYIKYVQRQSGPSVFYMAAENLGLFGVQAVAPLIENLRKSTNPYESTMTFYALRHAAQAPEIEHALGSTLPVSDFALPPAEEHAKLKERWLAWWTKHGAAIEKLAAEQAKQER